MSEITNVQDNNEQILNDIQSLQQTEQKLFNSLESNPNIPSDEQKKIIEKMNQLSNMRVNLYKTLSGVNNYFESAVNTTVDTLKEQVVAINIVEDELTRAKKRLEIVEQERNNKIRLVEINTYFGEKYAEHSQLMKIVIFTLVPIIVFAVLNNKGILPNSIYYILVGIVSLIGAYFFWMRFASIITRDNMNYQEYAWSFDPNNVSTTTVTTTTDPWQSTSVTGTCVGDACCSSGMTYDASSNQCIPESFTTYTPSSYSEYNILQLTKDKQLTKDTLLSKNTELNMIHNVLTKKQPNNYKIAYDLRAPKAFNN